MKKITTLLILILIPLLFVFAEFQQRRIAGNYGAPPYIEDDGGTVFGDLDFNPSKWVRPDGPVRVGLQAGHWKSAELPDELSRIRENGQGTSNGVIMEWEVNLRIAQEAARFLEAEGVVVDILPATVPEDYIADAFVAIHADGSESFGNSGFKVAAPSRDITGKAVTLAKTIEDEYAAQINMPIDPNITRNMTSYYAFNWRRYKHAVHPMTPSMILETGFLTNPGDAYMLINRPEVPAKALADGLVKFLKAEKLL